MKKLLVMASLMSLTATALAQGQIWFVTTPDWIGNDAAVFDCDGVTKLAGTSFRAQLYGGPAGTGETELTAMGVPVRFGTGDAAGYIRIGLGGNVAITGVPWGGYATVQMRVWNAPNPSYEAARTAPGGKWGWSNVITVDIPPQPSPGSLGGLRSFAMQACVPEPSTVALAMLYTTS
jgi:hypothetical protein